MSTKRDSDKTLQKISHPYEYIYFSEKTHATFLAEIITTARKMITEI